jgi:hypothetical protein
MSVEGAGAEGGSWIDGVWESISDFITGGDDDSEGVEAPQSAGPVHMTERAARTLDGDAGVMSDPGFSTRTSGHVTDVTGVPSGDLDTIRALATAASGLHPRGGAASVEYRHTVRTDDGSAPADEAPTVSAGMRLHGIGQLDHTGLDETASLVASGAEIYERAEALNEEVREIVQGFEGSEDVQRLRELAEAASRGELGPADLAEALTVARRVEADMRAAADVIEQMPKLLDEMDGLIAKVEDGSLGARAGATGGVFAEQIIGARTRTLKVDKHRFDAAVGVHMIQPGQLPESLRSELDQVDDLVTIKSTMVAVRAYVDITASGMGELRRQLRDMGADLGALEGSLREGADMLGDAADDPLGVMADAQGFADEAEAKVGELERQGRDLGDRARAMSKLVTVEARAGVEVDQPTGRLGGGIEEVSARWRWDPNQSFQMAVRGYVQNVAGYLEGTRDRTEIDVMTGDITRLPTESRNVYHSFFPRIYGADLGLSFNRDTSHRTDILAGASTDGDAVTAHVGLVQHLGRRVMLRMGLIDPDVTRRTDHTLIPRAGIDLGLGPRSSPHSVSLGLSGGTAISLGREDGPELTGGEGMLGLTFRF